MKLARYQGGGVVAIVEEPEPVCPPGGLLLRTLASGLCSGELMDWYMDAKIPHVLGHEICGEVIESQDERFAVGSLVAPHHHAPCFKCELCKRGAYVHCPTWRSTKLIPGGMAEFVAVPAANLIDTHHTNDLPPEDGALVEPLGCVMKSLDRLMPGPRSRVLIIGLGAMGLLHMLVLQRSDTYLDVEHAIGVDLDPRRREWARALDLDVRSPEELDGEFTHIVVCPGTAGAIDDALRVAAPNAHIVLFAPLAPMNPEYTLDLHQLYFRDIRLTASYSCGPDDTRRALALLRRKTARASQVVSDFVTLEELPEAYRRMKSGESLKAMVRFA